MKTEDTQQLTRALTSVSTVWESPNVDMSAVTSVSTVWESPNVDKSAVTSVSTV
jgi:hypothetical protein